ncbi:MAG TPA: ATP-binding cassette domain-containing protein [Planctomycetota bacterium]|nr:ATP-binding cassette domain-containing protein [Planctomycetota bacterium]
MLDAAPIVKIDRLSKRYGSFNAVAELDLQVPRGELFALLGPNGAGKTTTIKMLMGILQPTSGCALIDGLDCFRDRVEVKRRVGYLPDEPIFYDYLRGREILRFVGEMHGLTDEQINAVSHPLLERLELSDATEEYAVNYSKGMKKKLALICALMHDPMVLILDEPTNGLDPYATRTLHELVREKIAEGKTIFFSTHLLDQAERLCHRVGIVFKGKLAAAGTMSELRARVSQNSSLEEIFFSVTSSGAQVQPLPPGVAGTGEASAPATVVVPAAVESSVIASPEAPAAIAVAPVSSEAPIAASAPADSVPTAAAAPGPVRKISEPLPPLLNDEPLPRPPRRDSDA